MSQPARVAAQAEPGRRADPQPAGAAGGGDADVQQAPHRTAGEEGAGERDRQCREQPSARCRSAGGVARRGRALDRDAPLPCAWPRSRGARREVVQPSEDRRRRTRTGRASRRPHRWVTRSIRSGCGSASTAPGTAAGSPAPTIRKLLHEDLKLRGHLRRKLRGAGVSRVVIERPAKKPRVTIYAARPGVVIGKKGQDIEVLKKDLSQDGQGRRCAEHRRNPQAGDRRAAGGREHRPAARASRGVPPRDEARGAVGDAAGRAGHPDQLRRPARRRGDRARGVVSRRPRAAAHAARRYRLTARRRRRPPTAPAA